jgi:murein DD-endopeptidase MepM/ murein hydrolase activator NlpD
MDYGTGSRLHKDQWDLIHDPVSMLGWFQNEEDASDYTTDTDKEWIVEIYSNSVSADFLKATNANKHKQVESWINWALKSSLNADQLKVLKAISSAIPSKRDGSLPVAILKHYPNAKNKGLYVYYTEKQGGVIRAVKEPKVFTGDLPVDLSLHTGEFDAVDEKASPMAEETVQAYSELPYNFIWETMTEQGVVDQTKNWLKEAWAYDQVAKNEGVVRYLMDAIAKAEFGKAKKYTVEEQVVYTYGFELDDRKVPLALHILEDEPSFQRDDLMELNLSESKDKPYALLAFCPDKDLTQAKVLVQVGKKHMEQVKGYFTKEGDNVLADGTLLGNPVPKVRITSSGGSGVNGGRFGCTRANEDETCEGVKGKKYHGGLDIHAPVGTKIRSITQGTVHAAPKSEGGDLGYYIIVKSTVSEDEVLYILYAHLKEPSTKTGNVQQGDVIGTAGVTGNAKYLKHIEDRQHVHIVVKIGKKGDSYKQSIRVNPEKYLTTKFNDDGTYED